MDVGMMMVFASYGWNDCSDARVWEEEIRLARLAADLGFDCLWSAEHHFNDYSFVPDNLQLMTYLTALCPDVDLGTAAVILPWHDPLRVAEHAAVLDMLSKGRLRLGLGRGLARREFAAFRLSMNESRERFDEAAPMIVKAPGGTRSGRRKTCTLLRLHSPGSGRPLSASRSWRIRHGRRTHSRRWSR
jgi:alkanesulfonate monooxygenase SsuD/methylene tetrahydromethanopterin reductase-like flavin-dependent oxidoreductase (luciferase family)